MGSWDKVKEFGRVNDPVTRGGVSVGGVGEGGDGLLKLRLAVDGWACGVAGGGAILEAGGVGENVDNELVLPVIGAVVFEVGDKEITGDFDGDGGEKGAHGVRARVTAREYTGNRGVWQACGALDIEGRAVGALQVIAKCDGEVIGHTLDFQRNLAKCQDFT
jgi:hypothetical protein